MNREEMILYIKHRITSNKNRADDIRSTVKSLVEANVMSEGQLGGRMVELTALERVIDELEGILIFASK